MSECHPENVRFNRAQNSDVVVITDGENMVAVYGKDLHDFVISEQQKSNETNEAIKSE